MTITQKELATIRERAERATPGPWRVVPDNIGGFPIFDVQDRLDRSLVHTVEDAEFIAHAREDIPRLLDALEAAYERERRLIDALRWYAKTDNWTEGRLIRIEYPEIVVSVAEEDGGQHARATLKELGIEKESDAE